MGDWFCHDYLYWPVRMGVFGGHRRGGKRHDPAIRARRKVQRQAKKRGRK